MLLGPGSVANADKNGSNRPCLAIKRMRDSAIQRTLPTRTGLALQRRRPASAARNGRVKKWNQASQQQRIACWGKVGWGARSLVSLDVGNRRPSSRTTATDGNDSEQRSSRRSSGRCCRCGTAGSAGEPAQRQGPVAAWGVQHDSSASSVCEQQQPQEHCLSRQSLCFVPQEPTDGTAAIDAVATISSRETRIVVAERNMCTPIR